MRRLASLGSAPLIVLIALVTLLAGCHDGYHSYSYGYSSGHGYCPPPRPVYQRRTVVRHYDYGHHHGHGHRY